MPVAAARHPQQGRRGQERAELEDRALLGSQQETPRARVLPSVGLCTSLGTLRRVHACERTVTSEGKPVMHLEDAIRRRRMMRNFEATPVPVEAVDKMIDLASRSPSAGFSQGVDFVVLHGPEETARFWAVPELRAYWEREFPGVVRAPVLVLPIADAGAYLRRYSEPDKAAAGLQDVAAWPVPYWLVDTAMATMTLLLAAVDAGLAALFFGLFRRH